MMMDIKKHNTLIACPKCGRNATPSWIEVQGQCGACGAQQEKARVRALDVSPVAIADRLRTRSGHRPEWAPEDDERDHETRTLLEALADAERRVGELELAEAIMGNEITPNEEDPDEPRWLRAARATLEKWHGESHEQEAAVATLLFRERQRGRDAMRDTVQEVVTGANVRRVADGIPDDVEVVAGEWGANMDAGRLRTLLMERFFEHQDAGRDLSGKPRA